MPLGMEVGLGSGHVMLGGDPAPPRKRDTTFKDLSVHSKT